MTIQYDEFQQQVIDLELPPDMALRVVANAGAGKSTTMLGKVKRLIEDGMDPDSIVVFTFSRQARLDLEDKWKNKPDFAGINPPRITTIHSFGLMLSRKYLAKTVMLIKSVEQLRLIKKFIVEALVEQGKELPTNAVLTSAMFAVQDLISFYKAHCISLEKVRQCTGYPKKYKNARPAFRFKLFLAIFSKYAAYCKTNNYYDFDDLVSQTYLELKANHEALANVRRRFRMFIVDESQDLNDANWRLIMLLCKHQNLISVGDPCQNIYLFRYAKPQNFSVAYFSKYFSAVKSLELPYNYRSPPDIVGLGNHVRRLAQDSLQAIAVKPADKNPVHVYCETFAPIEGRQVVNIIQSLLQKYQLSDITVICRTTRFLTSVLEHRMIAAKIPYRLLASNSRSFMETSAAQIYTNQLALLVNPKNMVAYTSLIPFMKGMGEYTMGLRGKETIGKTAQTYIDLILKHGRALVTTGKKYDQDVHAYYLEMSKLSDELKFMKVDKALTRLRELNQRFLKEKFHTTDNQFKRIVQTIEGFTDDYFQQNRGVKNVRLAFQDAVLNLTDFDPAHNDPNRVTLSTVHAQKGLESKVSIVCGFRSFRQMPDIGDECNILYVQLSRAIEKLIIVRSKYVQYKERGVENPLFTAALEDFNESARQDHDGPVYP